MDNVRIETTAKTRATIEKLRHTDLLPELRKEMRSSTTEMVPAVKENIRGLPASRKRSTKRGESLRTEVARTITRKIKLNQRKVSIIITCVPKGGKSNLYRVLDGDIPWYHPTYGHRDREVDQFPHPFFFRPLEALTPKVTFQIERILDKFDREL